MNRGVFGVVGFVLGAAAGSLVAWKLLEKKYADIADAEIASVKETYSRKMAKKNSELKETYIPKGDPEEPKITENDHKVNSSLVGSYTSPNDRPDYTAYSASKKIEENSTDEETDIPEDEPYVITPEEFGEFEDYEKVELTYYADGILADDEKEIVDDPQAAIGFESLNHFGEYDDDVVYVRNDRRKCDYEVYRDSRRYVEVL